MKNHSNDAHKILAIVDASRNALKPILDAFRVVPKERVDIRIILLSFLSVLSKKHFEPLGPNTLFLLMQEEKDILESVRTHFKILEIPCSLRLITSPAWEEILDEIESRDQDLVILQGIFLKIWEECTKDAGLLTRTVYSPRCPILVIDHSKEKTGIC
jgi:hypothetical protein